MRPGSFISFAGFVMLIAATYCPLLRPLHISNWDMYACNKPYGIVVLLVSVVGIIGVVFMQRKLARLTAWLSVGLVILFYILCLLKIHYSFNFIPFHSLERFLDRQIKFKWGWWLLCAGPALSVIGVLIEKPRYKMPRQQKAATNTSKQG
jgi:predicted membrane channel-forming protein YqfA (hemolysin III family)